MFLNGRNLIYLWPEDGGHIEISNCLSAKQHRAHSRVHCWTQGMRWSTIIALNCKPGIKTKTRRRNFLLLWIKTSAQSHTLRFPLNPHTHTRRANTPPPPPPRRVQQRGVWWQQASPGKPPGAFAPTTRNGRGEVSTSLVGLTPCSVSSSYRRSLSRCFRRVNVSKCTVAQQIGRLCRRSQFHFWPASFVFSNMLRLSGRNLTQQYCLDESVKLSVKCWAEIRNITVFPPAAGETPKH